VLNPLVFAPVPSAWPDGKIKCCSGWSICRRPPFRGLDSLGQGDADETTTVTSSQVTIETNDDDESTIVDAIDDDGELERRQAEEKRKKLEALNNDVEPDTFIYIPPLGLPTQWIEVADFEEDEAIEIGCRVLCVRHKTGQGCNILTIPLRGYGTVLSMRSAYCYYVQFDDFDRGPVGRQFIEVITKRTFFCNIEKGLVAWTVEEAIEADRAYNESSITNKCPIVVDSSVWLHLNDISFPRRSFKDHDEMEHDLSSLFYYVEELVLRQELAVVKIQQFIRKRRKFPSPLFSWFSQAFNFQVPDTVKDEMHTLNGWTYIRRRSTFVGEFNSVLGEEWEEFMDNVSSEYLYWHEESNTHQWLKPETHKASAAADMGLNFNIGDEVEFRFPGDYKDEIGMVVNIRADDETGEFLYDITRTTMKREKRVPVDDFVPIKWVARYRIKKPALDREALELSRLEAKWRDQLRRQKAAAERMKKKLKQERMNEALAKIRDKLLSVQQQSDADAALVSNSSGVEVVVVKEKEENVMTSKEAKEASLNPAELLNKGIDN